MGTAPALGVLATGAELEVPVSHPGIGKVILSPDSPDLIRDVLIKPFPVWPDDRGYFLENRPPYSRPSRRFSRQFPGFRGPELSGYH